MEFGFLFLRKVKYLFENKSFFKLALFLFFAGFLFFSLTGHTSAATYYVATNGNDSNTAVQAQSTSTPWATVEYAIENQVMQFGDTLVLRAGTWDAANLWKSGSNKQIRSSYNITTPASGVVTIKAYDGENVTINVPSDTLPSSALFSLQGDFTFQHINFTNTFAVAVWLVNIQDQNDRASNISFEYCNVDYNNADAAVININNSVTLFDEHVNILGCKIKNVKSTQGFLRSAIDPNGIRTAYFNVKSSLFRNMGSVLLHYGSPNGPTNFTFINNTISNLTASKTFNNFFSNSTVKIENNIFNLDATYTSAIYTYNIIPDQNWTIKNNVFYRQITADPGTEADSIVTAWNEVLPLDATNYYFDPKFTNWEADDFSIQAESYISGRGLSADLPNTDINGNSWSGGHVGAYPNPSASPIFPTLQTNKVSFVGDSIAEGAGNLLLTDGRLSVVGSGNLGAAIGGGGLLGLRFLIDRAAVAYRPSTIFIIDGHNNFAGIGNGPPNITYNQARDLVGVAMEKAEYWGITPIWVGEGGIQGADQTTRPIAFNTAVQSMCGTHNWSCGSWLDYMRTINLSNWNLATTSGGYYQAGGLNLNVHPATEGYNVILSISEYLYYTKSTIGSTNIDIGAGARLYADGKFRNLNTPNSITANFSVTPVGGSSSFSANDKSTFLDITINSWLTTGPKNKEWTASSTASGPGFLHATSTIYTIGDLLANTYYQFKLDDAATTTAITGATCTNGFCLSDSSGNLTFTYSGGYSTHTFSLEKDNTSPNSFSLSVANNTSAVSASNTLSWDAASDSSGIAKYQLFFNGSLNQDNLTGTSATVELSCGSHTWFVRAFDNNSNTTDSATYTITRSCGAGSPTLGYNPAIAQLGLTPSTSSGQASPSPTPSPSPTSAASPEGKLIQYPNDPKVYLIEQGKKHWIQDIQTFNALNLKWSDVAQVPVTETYPDGETKIAPTSSVRPDNTLIQYANDPKVYILENGQKRWIKDVQTFNSLGLKWEDIVSVPATEIYPDGDSKTLSFTLTLQLGMRNDQVKLLQQYLNAHGFVLAPAGPGSPGNETTMFGSATRGALIKYQKANQLKPTGILDKMTRGKVNGN